MTSCVISECGLKPLPRIYPKPATAHPFLNPNLRISRTNHRFTSSFSLSSGFGKKKNWALGVSAPLRIQPVEEENRGGERVTNGGEEFDPDAPPPFNLSDNKAAILKHCLVKDPWRSVGYVVRDVVAAAAAYFNHWVVCLCIGLLKAPCFGLSLFLVMIVVMGAFQITSS